MTDQGALPLAPPVRCRRCDGTGETYYIARAGAVIGGKRIVCPECGGTGVVGAALPFVCPICQRQSWHPRDLAERFCAVCGFVDDVLALPKPEKSP